MAEVQPTAMALAGHHGPRSKPNRPDRAPRPERPARPPVRHASKRTRRRPTTSVTPRRRKSKRRRSRPPKPPPKQVAPSAEIHAASLPCAPDPAPLLRSQKLWPGAPTMPSVIRQAGRRHRRRRRRRQRPEGFDLGFFWDSSWFLRSRPRESDPGGSFQNFSRLLVLLLPTLPTPELNSG